LQCVAVCCSVLQCVAVCCLDTQTHVHTHAHTCMFVCGEDVWERGGGWENWDRENVFGLIAQLPCSPTLALTNKPPLPLAYSVFLTCVQYVSLTDSRISFFFCRAHSRTLVNWNYEERWKSWQPILATGCVGLTAEKETQQRKRGTRLSENDMDTRRNRCKKKEYLGDHAREKRERERIGLTQKNRDNRENVNDKK